MKRPTYLNEIIIFFLITVFCIIPPFFTTKIELNAQIFSWNFPVEQIGLCIFALILYFLSSKLNEKKKIFYPSILVLSILFFIGIIFKLISKTESNVELPSTKIEWLNCVIMFITAAIYEEVLYRFYFTDALVRIIKNVSNKNELKKSTILICEIIGLLAFSFAHLYLGILSVLNAFFAHILFRLLYKKTNLIWNTVIIHFIYNIISLILL